MRAAVIQFPGSNCDRDALDALIRSGFDAHTHWYADTSLPEGTDLVLLPGGFSYGDYLRSGAMAARAPLMPAIAAHAEKGGLVLGICNGFQVLTEAGLLPGTLMRNRDLSFICRETYLRVENASSPFTRNYTQGQVVNYPIAHHDGSYYADDETLKMLEGEGQVAFRYVTAKGEVAEHANPNGSRAHIAGVFNAQKNVLGLMPHPERHTDALLGGIDGCAMFEGLLAA